MSDAQAILAKLQALIEAERAALLSGDLDALATLVENKSDLLMQLSDETSLSVEDLQPIRSTLKRNQELFDHALAGVRNVVDRLGQVRRLRQDLSTYDPNGQRQAFGSQDQKRLEKRA
ncbi:flagellar protein FlgN [Thalassococcus sp. CAU 1522]|uniref:Flagellar protein FlgN n=1 Tax=Thalassococcus arenae TaxID=2851652 RepID=A0ABS6N737_9RHOB|nr:flagellar protein FlgN [Thalassococcus arenae]MBV2359325.1 flagellar protein FlgN [Thalassococcus arenae]